MVPILAALHVGVANVAGGTGAVLAVAQRLALCVHAAGIRQGARVDAGAVLRALLVRLAVGVLGALHALTLNLTQRKYDLIKKNPRSGTLVDKNEIYNTRGLIVEGKITQF